MLCDSILQYASPTLAGEKIGSLFRVPLSQWDMPNNKAVFSLLRTVHIQCIPVKKSKNSILLYLYSPNELKKVLSLPESIRFLERLGYPPPTDAYLQILLQRIRTETVFPHEVGLFLGYPLKDVQGFIYNHGRKSLYNGYWKVYENVEKAKKQFLKFESCKKCCITAQQEGASFGEILQFING